MSSILCLWKYRNYKREKKDGLNFPPAYNSKQRRLRSATELGDNAYIVTYVSGRCYLLAKITIAERYHNEPDYEYGEFGIEGDSTQSQHYECGDIDITDVLRRLCFKTGKRIGSSPHPISLHLQTLRELTEDDVALIESCTP